MAAVDPHYVWAFGHALTIISALRILVPWVMFKGMSARWYSVSYIGALLSYAIVCFKSIGTPEPSIQFIQKALLDENVQYFLLSLYWFISTPVTLSLIPFATFSLFHCATFIRANVIPKFSPPPAPSAGAQGQRTLTPAEQVGRAIQLWVKGNYDRAMKFVAYAELIIFVRVLVGAAIFMNSFFAPILFIHFLRMRYHHSAFTRSAVDDIISRADKLVAGQAAPVQDGWKTVKMVASKWSGTVLARRDGVPQAAGPGAAGARVAR